jgi:hypothetical protein
LVLEASENQEQEGKTGHQFFHVSLLQADALLDHRVYLDGYSTVAAFKSKQYLSNIYTVDKGVKINCNLGALRTNKVGDYGSMIVWFIPQRIANIFSMNKLEKKYRITYGNWQDYNVVHTAQEEVRYYKDKTGLPFIDLGKTSEDASAMLVQTGLEDAVNAFVQTVHQNYKGYTKKVILQAKDARQAMWMIENPSEQDFKGMVRGNMIHIAL